MMNIHRFVGSLSSQLLNVQYYSTIYYDNHSIFMMGSAGQAKNDEDY